METKELEGSIFPIFSLNRDNIHWEDYMKVLTPVHLLKDGDSEMFFKREDYFAPLGYGTVNGTKGRAGLWLAERHFQKHGKVDIVHGTVVHSPQNFFYPLLAKHFGGVCTTVLGATKPTTCLNHPMVKAAAYLGSDFNFVTMGYNSSLQKRCKEILKANPSYMYGEYGITLDHETHPIKDVAEFAAIGGEQVKNIPKSVDTLIIPFGSANSATGILTGLALFPQPNIKRVVLIGIGPNKLKWLKERLDKIGEIFETPHITHWKSQFHHEKSTKEASTTKRLFEKKEPEIEARFSLEHYDLHTTEWVKYSDMMNESFGGVEMHPRYEGKVLRYIKQNRPDLINEKSLFWIVGSYPRIEPMLRHTKELGETLPDSVVVNPFTPK